MRGGFREIESCEGVSEREREREREIDRGREREGEIEKHTRIRPLYFSSRCVQLRPPLNCAHVPPLKKKREFQRAAVVVEEEEAEAADERARL